MHLSSDTQLKNREVWAGVSLLALTAMGLRVLSSENFSAALVSVPVQRLGLLTNLAVESL